MALHIKIIRRL